MEEVSGGERMMRAAVRYGVGVLVLGLAAAAQAAPVPGPERAITDPKSVVSLDRPMSPVPVADLFFSRGVGGAAWSPDGKQVVISTNLTGRYNLWRMSADGSWPVQLTRSDDRHNGVTISADGKWVVFQSDQGGNEMYDLYAVPLAGGETIDLTNTAQVSETGAQFSPDGRRLAFAVKPKESPITNIAVMDMATRAVRVLTHEATSDNGWGVVAWTPDSQAIIANRQTVGATAGSVWRIGVADGAAKALTPADSKALVGAQAVSPDGRLVSLSSNEKTGQLQAGLLDMASGKITWLQASPWEQTAGDFSPDGKSVLFNTNADGRLDLLVYDIASGRVAKSAAPDGFNVPANNTGSSISKDGRVLVLHEGANTPTDLWVLDHGKSSRLTNLSLASLDPARLPTSQIVHYRSDDGTVISAVLIMPYGLKRDGSNPGIVLPHGGPTGQTQDRFSRTAIALASRGYVVIEPNPRGSTGYGTAFQNANHADLGGGDLQDEVAGAKFLVDTGYVNPKKIGITGGSYGGFMTLMAIGKTPDVWAAAVSLYGIINWYEMLKHEDAALQAYERSLIGDPVKDKAVYDATSPMTHIRKAKAPLLVLQGENDIRVPRGQAAEVVETLKGVGATVDVHYYPEEGHGFVKRENQIDSVQRTVDWFDKYLKGAK
jgi:dipeptidyl aminopeptidase/acylaminoacyl peptidase